MAHKYVVKTHWGYVGGRRANAPFRKGLEGARVFDSVGAAKSSMKDLLDQYEVYRVELFRYPEPEFSSMRVVEGLTSAADIRAKYGIPDLSSMKGGE